MQKNCKSVTKSFSNLLRWGANLLHIGTKQMQLIFITSNQLQKNCYFYTFWICKNVAIHSKKRMNKKNAWIQIVLTDTPIHGVIKRHCWVADKSDPQSSHHMSLQSFSWISVGVFSDFQRSFVFDRFSNHLLPFLLNSDIFS